MKPSAQRKKSVAPAALSQDQQHDQRHRYRGFSPAGVRSAPNREQSAAADAACSLRWPKKNEFSDLPNWEPAALQSFRKHVGHGICEPVSLESAVMCWPHTGQANLNSLMALNSHQIRHSHAQSLAQSQPFRSLERALRWIEPKKNNLPGIATEFLPPHEPSSGAGILPAHIWQAGSLPHYASSVQGFNA